MGWDRQGRSWNLCGVGEVEAFEEGKGSLPPPPTPKHAYIQPACELRVFLVAPFPFAVSREIRRRKIYFVFHTASEQQRLRDSIAKNINRF